MMSIEGLTIRVLLANESEFIFKYETEDQLTDGLRAWVENGDGTMRREASEVIQRFIPDAKHWLKPEKPFQA